MNCVEVKSLDLYAALVMQMLDGGGSTIYGTTAPMFKDESDLIEFFDLPIEKFWDEMTGHPKFGTRAEFREILLEALAGRLSRLNLSFPFIVVVGSDADITKMGEMTIRTFYETKALSVPDYKAKLEREKEEAADDAKYLDF